jgi:zinc transporter ZupT
MNFWQYILLFAAVLAGGLLAWSFQKANLQRLKLVLSFCGAYILGIIVLHLIPEAYSTAPPSLQNAGTEASAPIGLWVLGGFFLQLFLEQLSLGVEHGHIHDHHHTTRPLFALQVILGLSVHAFVEGLPLGLYADFHAQQDVHGHIHNHLFYGIMFHKAPEAFALVLLLMMSRFSPKIILAGLIFFAAMSPLGALLTVWLQPDEQILKKMIAVVIGSLLHVSTTILFETDNAAEHRISTQKLGAIIVGIGLSLLTIL